MCRNTALYSYYSTCNIAAAVQSDVQKHGLYSYYSTCNIAVQSDVQKHGFI